MGRKATMFGWGVLVFGCVLISAMPALAIPAFSCQSVSHDNVAAMRTEAESQADSETVSKKVTSTRQTTSTEDLRSVVEAAFQQSHDGWSSDEVILNSELNDSFLAQCQLALPSVAPSHFNWTLLNMRKAGLLKIKSTKRNHQSVTAITPIAEIAARLVLDRHQISSDRMMTDPALRAEFDAAVTSMDEKANLYLARKAAFRLRKQRRLKPELITRIADWGRTIQTFGLEDVRTTPEQIPEHPGIYIFRDASGYLYIGQSENLRQRLAEHLDASSNFSLAEYLGTQPISKNKKQRLQEVEITQTSRPNITIEIHSFQPDSRGKETMVRRAYESELIASRKPRFNLQP